jgi:beta-galactosidase GanA
MKASLLLGLVAVLATQAPAAVAQTAPHLEKRGQAVQLIVDGKPFLSRSGELRNSSATSREYMAPLWPQLAGMNINNVLAAVPWSMVERREGQFDFTMVDNLIEDARKNNQRLTLLWFGSWKNGLSHYTPEWVKKDVARFPRVLTKTGNVEVVTPLSAAALEADSKAFAAFMRHIKQVDGLQHTVIMIQVENEVGLIGDHRDRSPAAEAAFRGQVPGELMAALAKLDRASLREALRTAWASSNFRTSGTWEQVFGSTPQAEEIFMAYHYARYLDRVAAAGKREYDLPMFVNAWIVQPQDKAPGDYPSGGPQAHNHDIWKAIARNIDIFTPDIYLPDFPGVAGQYARKGEPFFVPESTSGAAGAANAFIAIGRFGSIGYSPFGAPRDEATGPFAAAYGVLRDIAPIVLEAQAKGTIAAVSLSGQTTTEEVTLGGYRIKATRGGGRGPAAAAGPGVAPAPGYGLIINTGPDEFLMAGAGVTFTFATATGESEVVGLADVEEGTYVDGVWKPGRNLSGDEIMISYEQGTMAGQRQTGSGVKFQGANATLQKVRVYRFPHGK